MKKVTIIGHFGGKEVFLDGQTVKTKIVAEELIGRFGEASVGVYDTFGAKKRILLLPLIILKTLIGSENTIIFPAQNGVRIIAPLLSLFNRIFHRKLHYAVIGGWLPEFLNEHKLLKRPLKRFDGIYVETNSMKEKLIAQGFDNIYVMPNCKKLRILDESELVYPSGEPYKLCTFSRVMKEKGIEDAVNAVRLVNKKCGKTAFELDIYGKVDENQTEWFEKLRKEFPPYVKYCGTVEPNESVETVKNYFLLLFPTHFYTEGIPGTILDALASGVPVLSSEWASCFDILNENIALTYCFDDYEELVAKLQFAAENADRINGMKTNCLVEAKKYLPENAMKILISNIAGRLM